MPASRRLPGWWVLLLQLTFEARLSLRESELSTLISLLDGKLTYSYKFYNSVIFIHISLFSLLPDTGLRHCGQILRRLCKMLSMALPMYTPPANGSISAAKRNHYRSPQRRNRASESSGQYDNQYPMEEALQQGSKNTIVAGRVSKPMTYGEKTVLSELLKNLEVFYGLRKNKNGFSNAAIMDFKNCVSNGTYKVLWEEKSVWMLFNVNHTATEWTVESPYETKGIHMAYSPSDTSKGWYGLQNDWSLL